MICLTELTRNFEGVFVVSDVTSAHGAGAVSLPALRPVRLFRQSRNAAIRVMRELLEGLPAARAVHWW